MTTGEGGMVATNDDEISEKIRLMRSHGMTTLSWERAKGHAFSYDVVEAGFNYRIDEIRSAIGLVQLEKLENNNTFREKLVQRYWERLGQARGIKIPFNNSLGIPSYHILPILLKPPIDRLDFMKYLKDQGIQTSIHYPPIHRFDYYRRSLGNGNTLNVTDEIGEPEVTLPLYPSMKSNDVDYVVDKINDFLRTQENRE
jgi:dTDP-4-amino-4,6-dideoxygalactose transaminase